MSRFLPSFVLLFSISFSVPAADWPQWGGGPTRNPVSPEKGLPLEFQIGGNMPERGIAWKVKPGGRMVVPPVVADGLVWVCTRAAAPADPTLPNKKWDGGLLQAYRESDGKLLWQHLSPRLSGQGVLFFEDFEWNSLGSCPLVEGDRLWYVNNRTEVVCFDIAPLKKGTGEPREVWKLDMRKELGVIPYLPIMQFGFGASVTGYKDKLYAVTHNGIYRNEPKGNAPDAPSLVCLDKESGKVVWKDNSPGKDILECQISSPLVAEIGGKAQVVVGQGDGWLRSFDASSGKLIWKCDLNAKDRVYDFGGRGTRNYVVATPISYENRVYATTGQQAENGLGVGGLYCIDPTKVGDVSRELEAEPKKGKPNPNSAVAWYTPEDVPKDAPKIEFGKQKKDLLRSRDFYFARSIAGCVAHDGLVYAADVDGVFYCFDAKTGKLYWGDDVRSNVYGQLLWVDGTVIFCSEDGDLYSYAHGKEKKRLSKIDCIDSIHAGPVFANGTLYITTDTTLYAIRKPK